MTTVYFDKNVLSHIISSQRGAAEANGVTMDDVESLRSSVASGRLVGLLSEMHLQEAAYALRAPTPEAAGEELQLIQDLMDIDNIIKAPKDLLIDDVVSYARGEAPGSPLIPNPYDLERVFNPADVGGFKKALDDTDRENVEFRVKGEVADANDREIHLREFGKHPSFEEFYRRKIRQRIESLVKRVEMETGLDWLLAACEERGIEGMLAVRSVAVCEGINLSYQYASVFGELRKNIKFRKGDPPDLKHALLASAADIFVTHDQDLAAWVNRIPNRGYKVLRHIHELVEHMG